MATGIGISLLVLTANCIWGSTADFLSAFTSIAFLCLDIAARQWKFKLRVFLSVDGLPSWADKLYIPKAAVYEASIVHLRSYFCLEMDLSEAI